MARDSLDGWLAEIEEVHPKSWDLGLERVRQVAERLGILVPAPLIFLVAGTNGKGSTCEVIDRLCRACGLIVGKSTSPHLLEFNERIQIDGNPCGDEEICAAFGAIEAARGATTLTYFEFATLASLFLFRERRVDVAVLEVGLGGRLDAMNIVEPDVAVITQIALDHQNWLGETRMEIGAEKAAIMRKDRPCALGDRTPPDSVLQYAANCGAHLLRIGEDFDCTNGELRLGSRMLGLSEITHLPGESVVTAVQAVLLAGISPDFHKIGSVLADAKLPGRRHEVMASPRMVLDVAHNPAAASSLSAWLATQRPHGKLVALVGMYSDKDYQGVLGACKNVVDEWYFTDLPDERGISASVLADWAASHGCHVSSYAKLNDAYASVMRNCGIEDMVIGFGSFPLVAGVLTELGYASISQLPDRAG